MQQSSGAGGDPPRKRPPAEKVFAIVANMLGCAPADLELSKAVSASLARPARHDVRAHLPPVSPSHVPMVP